MGYTLEAFAADCKAALKNNTGDAALEAAAECLRKALRDQDLVEKYVPETMPEEKKIIFEDPDLGFVIRAHNYKGAKGGSPHDHGPTWAIYGQASGETTMTEWKIVRPANGDDPALVEKEKTYTMKTGDAQVYPVGTVHAPFREDSTRLIRIEGQNCDNLTRPKIKEAVPATV